MNIVDKNEVKWTVFDHFSEEDGLVHGFSTRIGGVSAAPYSTLNLAFHVGDEPEDVIENRKKFCEALGIDINDLTAGEQVHGDKIRLVTGEDRGSGAFDYQTAFSCTDGFITNQPGVVLSSYYADCVPLFIYDPVHRAVALAHAGWKGTVKRIGAKTIRAMGERFDTRAEDCLVGIGPSIGGCCYQVDEYVIDPFKKEFDFIEEVTQDEGEGHWLLDLPAANRHIFRETGVPAENIEMSQFCTSCRTDLFYSYRAENGDTGRMASIIMLKPSI